MPAIKKPVTIMIKNSRLFFADEVSLMLSAIRKRNGTEVKSVSLGNNRSLMFNATDKAMEDIKRYLLAIEYSVSSEGLWVRYRCNTGNLMEYRLSDPSDIKLIMKVKKRKK